jgi:Mg2+ and Co2+ transporter CorA
LATVTMRGHVASIYGMISTYASSIGRRLRFALSLCVASSLAMFLWMKFKKWI